jgi:hypothetical protein
VIYGVVAGLFGFATNGFSQISPKLYSVLASVQTQTSPTQITLNWPLDPDAGTYSISRKAPEEANWVRLSSLDASATNFSDTSVNVGTVYEYQIIKTNSQYTGYQYLLSGIEAPLVDQRGKVILIVDNTYAADLASELAQLQQDLTGDGWTVLRHDVSPADTVTSVKSLILADYNADPTHVQAVFLFGAIPVPYSGNLTPDGHPNHQGAWPADVYYGDMQGLWTDSSVTATNAERVTNWNIPGDGKFDQNAPPGGVALQIGRVDLSNMTCYANKTPSRSELDLLRRYLVKDHNFRNGLLNVQRQGLICDNFQDKGSDPVGCSGWRNFAAFFGADNITAVGWSNYFPTVTAQSYLWTYGSGGGQYYSCTGVGSSDDFALQDAEAVFTMWLGSYFGDWNNESNFLRAPLGSTTYTLTSSYSGSPYWLYHPMALGQTMGYCARLTQNNLTNGTYAPYTQAAGQVHIALLGDPTLRMHPVLPPSNLGAAMTPRGVKLTWTASSDTDLRGYHVYRAATDAGPFLRITGSSPITDTTYSDSPPPGTYSYMVRAAKLERSSSGTYLNPSQGVFASVTAGAMVQAPTLQIARQPSAVALSISGQSGQQFILESSRNFYLWTPIFTNTLANGAVAYTDPLGPGFPIKFYRSETMSQ